MVSIAGKIFETALVISSGKSILIQGNPPISTRHLGLPLVTACNRRPTPAAKMMAFKLDFSPASTERPIKTLQHSGWSAHRYWPPEKFYLLIEFDQHK